MWLRCAESQALRAALEASCSPEAASGTFGLLSARLGPFQAGLMGPQSPSGPPPLPTNPPGRRPDTSGRLCSGAGDGGYLLGVCVSLQRWVLSVLSALPSNAAA